jgi:DNA-binding MarR family transcriptional regulator
LLGEAVTLESVLDIYRRLMRVVQMERVKQHVDPWYDFPMTFPQLRALNLIAASERGLSSRELATLLNVGASAITPLVDRLVERGFVLRNEDPHDRRIARLHATDSGSAMLERMRIGQGEIVRNALAELSPQELESVGAALELLYAAIQRTSKTIHATTQLPQGTPA